MSNLQRAGGVAALLEAAAFTTGIVLVLAVLMPAGFGAEGGDVVAFFSDNQLATYALYVGVYVASSVVQTVLVLAIYERLKHSAAAIIQPATAFGLIWSGVVLAAAMIASIGLSTVINLHGQDPAQANLIWSVLALVFEGLGGGTELVGGIWFTLISLAALQIGGLPRLLNYLGIIIGLAGILSVIPALNDIVDVFGIGSILWFVWAGMVLIRSKTTVTTMDGSRT